MHQLMERTGVKTNTTSSSSFPVTRFLQAPVTTVLEYSGVLPPRSNNDYDELESLIRNSSDSDYATSSGGDNHEVSIQIIEEADQEEEELVAVNAGDGGRGERGMADSREADGGSGSRSDSLYQQRFHMRLVSRWIQQILPFSLLLLNVFLQQHLQGLSITIYVTTFMDESNDTLRKQTALKGERRLSVLAGYFVVFVLHVIGVYWWCQNDNLYYPLFMVPPRAIPPFWHAIFTIIVNDTMVRQSAMAFKLVLLMYYRNGKGDDFRRQGQMLTLVEYALLLYRAFLPAPVWYRFFLNKENGSLFSSLITGLYLSCKLSSIVKKVGSLWTSFKALSRNEVHYVSYATTAQEKMQAPVLLRCKHIFCEDCVSEWFERENMPVM